MFCGGLKNFQKFKTTPSRRYIANAKDDFLVKFELILMEVLAQLKL